VSPRLEIGHVATTDDERIANVLTALQHETSPEADTARWAIENWQAARAALVAIRETGPSAEVVEIVAEGLEVAES
jgi:hypothetical protein